MTDTRIDYSKEFKAKCLEVFKDNKNLPYLTKSLDMGEAHSVRWILEDEMEMRGSEEAKPYEELYSEWMENFTAICDGIPIQEPDKVWSN